MKEKKKIKIEDVAIAVLLILTILITIYIFASEIYKAEENKKVYVTEFTDKVTGVHYYVTNEMMIPRYNPDGSLYCEYKGDLNDLYDYSTGTSNDTE